MRVWAVVVWLVAAVAGAVVGGQVFDRAVAIDELSPDAESMRVEALLRQWDPEGPIILAVIKGRDPYDPELVASVEEITRTLASVAKVESLYNSPGGMIGKDARSTLVRAELIDPSKQDVVVTALRQIKAPTVLVGGEPVARQEFADRAVRDAMVGESIAIAILVLVLILFLRKAAWVPIAAALATVAVTLLVLRFLTVSEFAVNVVTLLGLGLSVDYALLIIWRYREDGDIGRARQAVLISGSAVAIALLGLMVFAEPLLAAMAMGGLAATVVATAVATTLVPALLPRHPPPTAAGQSPSPAAPQEGTARQSPGPAALHGATAAQSSWIAAVAEFAIRRPGRVALWSAGLLVVLALPFAGVNLHNSDARSLPASSESRRVYEEWLHTFRQRPEPVTVVVHSDAGGERMRDYLNRLNRLPGVKRLELRPDLPADKTVIDLTPDSEMRARDVVRAVRQTEAPAPFLVGGPSAEVVDYQAAVLGKLPLVLGVLLVAMLGLLYLLTGSLVIPIKALALNILSLGASLGVLTMVFNDLDLTTPVLLFVFIFGLSMDYEVFIIARITEEYRKTGDNATAIVNGLARTGPVITAAAVCLIVVFLGFVVGELAAVREIGVGMAIALILDVTIVRALLLPATMSLLGRWNWWPDRQRSDAALPQRASAT